MRDQERREGVAPDLRPGGGEAASFAAGEMELSPSVGAEFDKEAQHPFPIFHRDMGGEEGTKRLQALRFGEVAKVR
jgi:hypothetical protein